MRRVVVNLTIFWGSLMSGKAGKEFKRKFRKELIRGFKKQKKRMKKQKKRMAKKQLLALGR